ncbi:MAG: hypothetical protein ACLQG5_03805 [Methanobacterium sp.]|jgi:predicted transcriptional regulator
MPNQDSSVDEILSDLDMCERRVLRFLGKEKITKNKNIRHETIKNRLPDENDGEIDNAIESLLNKGLMFQYRPKNYGLSSIGVTVAQSIVKEFLKERYGDLRILMVVLIP